MNKYSNELTIYDNAIGKLNFDNENIICWNNYLYNKKSILNQIESESNDIKKEIIKELDFFHTEHRKNLKKIDINIDKKINFGSINSMFDNNIYDQISINEYVKFFQLKKIIKHKKINQIHLYTKNNELKKFFSFFAKYNNIKLNIKLTKKEFSFNKKYIKKIIHPVFLALPIFLIFLFKRIKYFLNSSREQKKTNENLFVNYFFGSSFSKESFYSVYWKNLDEVLENNKIKRTWLHLSVPENHSHNDSKQLLNKLNTNPLSEHLMLDSYFNFKTFLKIIFVWFKIVMNINKINKLLKIDVKDPFLYFLFENDFKENIFGYKFLINLYYFYLFKNFLNDKSEFKNCFYLHENQSWERSLICNLNTNKTKTNKFAVIHSSIRFWDFRYIEMYNLYKDFEFMNFSHDKILIGSDKFKEILLDNNISDNKIILVEALRYKNNSDSKNKIYVNKNKNDLVVMGDYAENINQKIELCINLLAKINKYKIICKPHPLKDFKKKLYINNNLFKSFDTVNELAQKYDNFIVSNTSTVGLELYLMGKNVITILDDKLINFSPLKHYYGYQNYVFDINEIENKINNGSKNFSQNNFFKDGKNLENWIKIINHV
mgnify:FL=1|jgi:surface carbohydrate biosynthesis protein (TIGR04326 family)